jgi:RNA-dependent RNA polymerase
MESKTAALTRCLPDWSVAFRGLRHVSDYTGVADETGTLKEGEVFCQYQENDDSMPRVVVSEVLVCRAPACESLILVVL